jgi:histidinol dehydrogenase
MLDVVRPIFDAVLSGGDDAVRRFTEQYDGVLLDDFHVHASRIESSSDNVKPLLVGAIAVAASNIDRFHRAQLRDDEAVETMPGVKCWRRSVPIRKVGLYVPGGTAPLLSTVLMLAIPAKIAGCEEIVICTPPGPDGEIDSALLYAASVAGVRRVFRVGGAQAIAAMTYGTQSIPRVDKIFGPGNQYVTAAKQYAALEGISIDMPAGPTEVAIVADAECPVDFVASDILAQAEHGPDSHVLLVTFGETFGQAVIDRVGDMLDSLPRADVARQSVEKSVCVVVSSDAEAMELCNAYAPEHLIIATSNARELADTVRTAGSVFVGPMSPEAAGDYASGTNHTLPTGGAARAYSGVSVDSFLNRITFQELTADGLRQLGPSVMALADAEGLEGHRRSVRIRLDGE